MNSIKEAIKEVEKQPHDSSSLEQTLIDTYKMLGEKKKQEVRDRLKQIDSLREIHTKEVQTKKLRETSRGGGRGVKLKTLLSHLKYVFL